MKVALTAFFHNVQHRAYSLTSIQLFVVVMLASFNVLAAEVRTRQKPLTVSVSGTGLGTVTGPNKLSCTTGNTCTVDLDGINIPVTLTATPGTDSVFSGWATGPCSPEMVIGSGTVTISGTTVLRSTGAAFSRSWAPEAPGKVGSRFVITNSTNVSNNLVASVRSDTELTLAVSTTLTSGSYEAYNSPPTTLDAKCSFTVPTAKVVALFDHSLAGPTHMTPYVPPSAPPFSGVQGYGQTWFDPISGVSAVRMTDSRFPAASSLNRSYHETNGGTPKDLSWSKSLLQADGCDVRLKFIGDQYGNKYLVAVQFCEPNQWTILPAYNGFTVNGGVEFSRSDPCRFFLWSGTSILYYEFGPDVVPASWGITACANNPTGQPTAETLVNFLSGDPNGLPSDFGALTWSDAGNIGGFEGSGNTVDGIFYGAYASAKYHFDGSDWCPNFNYANTVCSLSGPCTCTTPSGGTAAWPSPTGRIEPLNNNAGYCSFALTTPGQSGATEPTWSISSTCPSSGMQLSDGANVWTSKGLMAGQDTGYLGLVYSPAYGIMRYNTATATFVADPEWGGYNSITNRFNAWKANTYYSDRPLSTPIQPAHNNPGRCSYQVIVGGTSGTSEPNPWPGSTTAGCTASQTVQDGQATWANTGLQCNSAQCSGNAWVGYGEPQYGTPWYATVHAGNTYADGRKVLVGGTISLNDLPLPKGPALWVPGTTNIYDPSPVSATGHNNEISLGFVNNANSAGAPFQYRTEALVNPPGPGDFTYINEFPTGCGAVGTDQHMGGHPNMIDTNNLAFTYTLYDVTATDGLQPFDAPTCPWTDEIDFLWLKDRTTTKPGDASVNREFYTWNSEFDPDFYTQNNLFTVSIDHVFASVGSDGFQSIRSVANQATCTPAGPDWQGSKAYPLGYYITPKTNNPAQCTYQVITAGASASSYPTNWVGSGTVIGDCSSGMQLDPPNGGGVIWNNVGYANFDNRVVGTTPAQTACAAEILAFHIKQDRGERILSVTSEH